MILCWTPPILCPDRVGKHKGCLRRLQDPLFPDPAGAYGVPEGRGAGTEHSPVFVDSVEEAVEFLKGTQGHVLVTTGSKELSKYKALPDWEERIYARVLSLPQVVSACGDLGFYGNHLMGHAGAIFCGNERWHAPCCGSGLDGHQGVWDRRRL